MVTLSLVVVVVPLLLAHGWDQVQTVDQKVSFDQFELFPASYYRMGQYLEGHKRMFPLELKDLMSDHTIELMREALGGRIRSADPDLWTTKVTIPYFAVDGRRNLGAAFIQQMTSITLAQLRTSVSSEEREMEIHVRLDEKLFKDTTITDHISLLEGVRASAEHAFRRYITSHLNPVTAPDVTWMTMSKQLTKPHLLSTLLRRDLICVQLHVQHNTRPRAKGVYASTSKWRSFVLWGTFAQASIMNPNLLDPKRAIDIELTKEKKFLAESNWTLAHIDGAYQYGVDTLPEPLLRAIAERSHRDYVCSHASVLGEEGQNDHCVFLGTTYEETRSKEPSQLFATNCGGRYPARAAVVSKELREAGNGVAQRWVLKTCQKDGTWTTRYLSDSRGSEIHSTCTRYRKQPYMVEFRQAIAKLLDSV